MIQRITTTKEWEIKKETGKCVVIMFDFLQG